MRLPLLLLLALAVVAAGCTAPRPAPQGAAPLEPPAASDPTTPTVELHVENYVYTNPACSDEHPLTVDVRNAGTEAALGVTVRVDGGTQGSSADLGDIPAGEARTASLTVMATDTCGQEDWHELVFTATAANAAEATLRVTLST